MPKQSKNSDIKLNKEEEKIYEFSKYNSDLLKCLDMVLEQLNANTNHLINLQSQNLFLLQKLNENTQLIELLVLKSGLDKSNIDDIKKILNNKIKKEEKKEEVKIEKNPVIFHDDLTTKCKLCGSIMSLIQNSCNECGSPK